ncbi:MAG: hypothetical protein KGL39_08460 [Patescibacteria group bacterium]|nr:hypothetical protein [Patescibacteria group bacterium]
MTPTIPNRFPLAQFPQRIALIGEAPCRDEVAFNRPFIGASGRFLAALLSRAGVSIDNCFLGNISQYQPPDNNITVFTWSGDEIQEGLYQLEQDLKQFKPNIVVLLGNIPLKAAKDPFSSHPLVPKAFKFKNANWRGSLFVPTSGPFTGLKCISAYHPAYCLRDYESTPLLQFDLRKAVRESRSPILVLPERTFAVACDNDSLVERLRCIRHNRQTVAIDIEGGIDSMSCISFATSPRDAFIVPFYTKDGTYVSSLEVWRELALTLEDPRVPKILQNSLYDRFVLHFSYGIRVRGVVHDTMLKHWELYSELEKSLGVQTSIYTDEPYYKSDRESNDDKLFYEYCCRDSAVTLEISDKLNGLIHQPSLGHYELNMGLLNTLLYMELRGIRYDYQAACVRRLTLLRRMHECQAKFNALTGFGFAWNSFKEITDHARTLFFTKDGKRPYKDYIETVAEFQATIQAPAPDLATIGKIEDLCETSLNVNSSKQFNSYLYETLKLPVQMSQERDPTKRHVTSDYEALLNLSRWCLQHDHTLGHQVCQAAIELRALETRAGMLSITADKDGRIRCGYNLVGSNTGRITCYESPTGSGYNLQTIPNYTKTEEAPGGITGDRDLFLADEGYCLFQCDLAGADGWTVAAYSAMLGDSTMLDDYQAGIKPYARLALRIAGDEMANCKDRAQLREYLGHTKLEPIPKLMSKRVQHGAAYLEGGLTISRNVLKDSEGKVYISPRDGDELKEWYLTRYWGIRKWHDWVQRRLSERPILTAASGQVRQFFGRPDEILTKAVAFEPQANTTYATNLAAWRLWTDPENRIGNRLRIEPLHQVHDALIGQFKIEDTTWAISKIKQWFDNSLTIAGQQIVIPFEGAYGESWGVLDKGKI